MTQADVALMLFLSLAGQHPPAQVATAPQVQRCRVVPHTTPAREVCVTVRTPQRMQVAGLK